MKQTAAILLILLMVFNITGYRFTVQWMQQTQNRNLEKELDNADYDEASLIEISVPLSLPYYNNWPDFERYDGEVLVNGITYKYVKRKVQDGKLILKCLPNSQQQTIQKNVSELFAQANGLPQQHSASGAVKKVIKAGLSEYEEVNRPQFSNPAFTTLTPYRHYQAIALLKGIPLMAWQPPEVIG